MMWMVLAAVSILLTGFSEYSGFAFLCVFAASLIGFRYFWGLDTLWPLHHLSWDWLVGYTLVYLGVGLLWSFFKWFNLCIEYRKTAKGKPDVDFHKERIARWIAFWPANVAYTVLFEMLEYLALYFIKQVRGAYEGLTEMVWRHGRKQQ